MSEQLVFELAPKLFTMIDSRGQLSVITMMLKQPISVMGVDFWFQTALALKGEDGENKILMHVPNLTVPASVKFHEGLLALVDKATEMGRRVEADAVQPIVNELTDRLKSSKESNVKALAAIEALNQANSDLKDRNILLSKRVEELEAASKAKQPAAKKQVEEVPAKKKGLGTSTSKKKKGID